MTSEPHGWIREPVTRLRCARFTLALGCVLVAGCLAPRRGDDGARTGSVEELAQMLDEGGAEKVVGTVEEGPATPPPEGDPYAFADPQDVQLPEELPILPPEESPYIRFGERIIVRETDAGETFITKPYSLPVGRGQKLVELMTAFEPFAIRSRPVPNAETGELPPLDPALVEYQLLAGWDQEFYTNFQAPLPVAPPAVGLSDILVVTATSELLATFEDFVELFAAAGVPQIELEAKIIEIVESDTLDVGVSTSFTFPDANLVDEFSSSLGNVRNATEALLTLGAVQDGLIFDATLEAVKTWQNVQIDSRPKTVVRAGGVASLESTTEIPFLQIKTLTPDGAFTTATEYKKVGVQLFMSPRIIGTKTLALDVQLEGSTLVGSQVTLGVAGSTVVESPIIAYRTAKTVVYLEPGQTLVIGGLTQEADQEIVNKVPILGDIPILGWFFRSKFTEKERQHVLFAISPRIIQRSDFDSEL